MHSFINVPILPPFPFPDKWPLSDRAQQGLWIPPVESSNLSLPGEDGFDEVLEMNEHWVERLANTATVTSSKKNNAKNVKAKKRKGRNRKIKHPIT